MGPFRPIAKSARAENTPHPPPLAAHWSAMLNPAGMFVSIATTHQPPTDLGYLLMKHPERVHETELTFGAATVFYPQASAERCEAALVMRVDPVGLVRGRGQGDGLLSHYVNDRPYAASSFLAVALNRAFRTAITGVSRERPELAAAAIPLELTVTPLPGGADLARALFEPLGWTVSAMPVDDAARYHTLRLTGAARVADALAHLYVLIPVLDAEKHYWVGEDELEKLIAKGGAWLAGHPLRELIARRYLKKKTRLVQRALARLAPEENQDAEDDAETEAPRALPPEAALEAPLRLNDIRLDTVHRALKGLAAARVADLGCGEGQLLLRLNEDRFFTRIIGLDASARELERAARRLKLDRAGGVAERITLLHGALTYRDARWHEVDAACLVEVIEHLDAERLPALEKAVFGHAKPPAVIVTTPNVEHNALFPNMAPGAMRHPDHRFEWTRAQFSAWADAVAARYGYRWTWRGIGADDERHGPPTQMGVFQR
jgi:3' terminal RNA ribose 2'-O-methyltransferase Hen1